VTTANKFGNPEIVLVFESSPNDNRTKLPARLTSRFSAVYGDNLYFQQEEGRVVVTKHFSPGGIFLFQISVDVERRARLTKAKLDQLGAVYGDHLKFTFIEENKATVEILPQQVDESQPSISLLPEEIENPEQFIEGALKQITINAYERDPNARRACIERYGLTCSVCAFNFVEFYGEVGEGYIHVHHLTPISSIREEYSVDPIQDLRPICPNCHAMIHKKRPPYTIEEMRHIIECVENNKRNKK
jgi:hypothetical protein